MSTVPTPDTTLAKIKGWMPVIAAAVVILGFAANEYHWLKSGGNGPPPAPPVIEVAEVAPAPRLAAAKPELGRRTSEHLVATRIKVRLALAARGLDREQIRDALDLLDGPLIDVAVKQAEAERGETIELPKPGAFGDGSILQAIIDWFKSPQGQSVLAALLKMLLAALGLLVP